MIVGSSNKTVATRKSLSPERHEYRERRTGLPDIEQALFSLVVEYNLLAKHLLSSAKKETQSPYQVHALIVDGQANRLNSSHAGFAYTNTWPIHALIAFEANPITQ